MSETVSRQSRASLPDDCVTPAVAPTAARNFRGKPTSGSGGGGAPPLHHLWRLDSPSDLASEDDDTSSGTESLTSDSYNPSDSSDAECVARVFATLVASRRNPLTIAASRKRRQEQLYRRMDAHSGLSRAERKHRWRMRRRGEPPELYPEAGKARGGWAPTTGRAAPRVVTPVEAVMVPEGASDGVADNWPAVSDAMQRADQGVDSPAFRVWLPKLGLAAGFPEGYALFMDMRWNERGEVTRRDCYLYGHPLGTRFRSPAEFVDHLEWIAAGGLRSSRPCRCRLCPKRGAGGASEEATSGSTKKRPSSASVAAPLDVEKFGAMEEGGVRRSRRLGKEGSSGKRHGDDEDAEEEADGLPVAWPDLTPRRDKNRRRYSKNYDSEADGDDELEDPTLVPKPPSANDDCNSVAGSPHLSDRRPRSPLPTSRTPPETPRRRSSILISEHHGVLAGVVTPGTGGIMSNDGPDEYEQRTEPVSDAASPADNSIWPSHDVCSVHSQSPTVESSIGTDVPVAGVESLDTPMREETGLDDDVKDDVKRADLDAAIEPVEGAIEGGAAVDSDDDIVIDVTALDDEDSAMTPSDPSRPAEYLVGLKRKHSAHKPSRKIPRFGPSHRAPNPVPDRSRIAEIGGGFAVDGPRSRDNGTELLLARVEPYRPRIGELVWCVAHAVGVEFGFKQWPCLVISVTNLDLKPEELKQSMTPPESGAMEDGAAESTNLSFFSPRDRDGEAASARDPGTPRKFRAPGTPPSPPTAPRAQPEVPRATVIPLPLEQNICPATLPTTVMTPFRDAQLPGPVEDHWCANRAVVDAIAIASSFSAPLPTLEPINSEQGPDGSPVQHRRHLRQIPRLRVGAEIILPDDTIFASPAYSRTPAVSLRVVRIMVPAEGSHRRQHAPYIVAVAEQDAAHRDAHQKARKIELPALVDGDAGVEEKGAAAAAGSMHLETIVKDEDGFSSAAGPETGHNKKVVEVRVPLCDIIGRRLRGSAGAGVDRAGNIDRAAATLKKDAIKVLEENKRAWDGVLRWGQAGEVVANKSLWKV
ncbi:hypothetical protein BDK51DRAFT_43918 [Blyttiomyces helicus]|uniref:Cryptic loci regulator 2 N-terminal domain-containing protein n=1 Tax=Blyttiomyces helicus TaxID=388810 RepID=A0A4P9WG97_9FUNG|nr:hypothetical protein BDK51DRAFT_43918 [Blyttiomyces helicus]|eukprot:RKO91829.1 hypothetical protein BDK51DRAFT_43918 [Blyttiomyces helicus]